MTPSNAPSHASPQGPRPLDGITVVSLEHAIAAPFCSRQLADLGARVIKIETPGGEHLRKRSVVAGAALPFAMLNGNKQAVTMNLKDPRGKQLLLDM